jgi:hypothetical protein
VNLCGLGGRRFRDVGNAGTTLTARAASFTMCGIVISVPFPWQAAEKVTLAVVLGGAAVYRCDNCIVLNAALAAEGALSAREILFPQPAGVTIHGSRR